MGVFPLDLKLFHVSEKNGFIMETPLETLPTYFEPWNVLAHTMPDLVLQKAMRDEVHAMPLLDHERLSGHRQLRLAHLQLSLIASGYVWEAGDSGAAKVLPKCIAVPWHAIATKLGLPLVLCYSTLILANYKKDDEGAFQVLYQLPGRDKADTFITVTLDVEQAFASGLNNLMSLLEHAQNGDEAGVTTGLHVLTQTVQNMTNAMARMHETLTGETFFNVMRPYLAGWGTDGSPLPDGLIYEGVSEDPKVMIGGSAAQSSTIQCIDAALGVEHKPDIKEFMAKMRAYMNPAHKDFIDTIKEHSRVKEVVNKTSCDTLRSAYNEALRAVMDFRSCHIRIVAKYIIVQAGKEDRSKDRESLAKKGTGGSSLMPFLKSLRSTTGECKMADPEQNTED